MSILNDAAIYKMPAENDEVFSQDYNKGDCIQRYGLLYKTSCPVSQGDTIVINDNLEMHPLVDERIKSIVDRAPRINFIGTRDGWDKLTTEQKARFDSTSGAKVEFVDEESEDLEECE